MGGGYSSVLYFISWLFIKSLFPSQSICTFSKWRYSSVLYLPFKTHARADRLAVAEKVRGVWTPFTGNEIGALLGHWQWVNWRKEYPAADPSDVYMVASTVSSKVFYCLHQGCFFSFFCFASGCFSLFSWSASGCFFSFFLVSASGHACLTLLSLTT